MHARFSPFPNPGKPASYIYCFQLLQILYGLFSLARLLTASEEPLDGIRLLILTLYLERLSIGLLKDTALLLETPTHQLSLLQKTIRSNIKTVAANNFFKPSKMAKHCREHAEIWEDNLSTMTNAGKNLEQFVCMELIPDITERVPAPIKSASFAVCKPFTMSANQYVIRAIKSGNCIPEVSFTDLTCYEKMKLIRALQSWHVSPHLKITYGEEAIKIIGEDMPSLSEISIKARKKHAFKACVTFQQGFRSVNSIIQELPQEILNQIYEQVHAAFDFVINKRNFTDRVTAYYPGFFALKQPLFSSTLNQPEVNGDGLAERMPNINFSSRTFLSRGKK